MTLYQANAPTLRHFEECILLLIYLKEDQNWASEYFVLTSWWHMDKS